MKVNRIRAALAGMLAALVVAGAQAHGDTKPRHGGIVEVSGDIKFELVISAAGAEIHIDDHGQTVPTAGSSGKLTVMSGGAKSEAALEPAPGDKLVARDVKLAKGDRVIAVVTLPDKSKASVRFLIK